MQTLPALPSLETGVVQLWHAEASSAAERCLGLLPADEASRAERFRVERSRHEHVLGKALSRLILGQQLGVAPREVRFRLGPRGKPELAQTPAASPVRFNISHSAGLVVGAFSLDTELGIDVEAADRIVPPLVAERVFTADERAAITVADDAERVAAAAGLWTLKEAYIKARGDGLAFPLQDCSFGAFVGCHEIRLHRTLADDQPQAWRFFQTRLAPRHIASLALRCPPRSGERQPAALRIEIHDLCRFLPPPDHHDRLAQPHIAVG